MCEDPTACVTSSCLLSRTPAAADRTAGATDHITPPAQVFAVATPAADVVRRTTRSGHLGLFMGHEALRTDWPALAEEIRRRSG